MYFNVKSYLPDVSIVVCFSFLGFFVAFFNNGSNGLGYKFYVNKEEVKYNASSGFVGFFPSSCSGNACPLAAFLMLENIYSRKL